MHIFFIIRNINEFKCLCFIFFLVSQTENMKNMHNGQIEFVEITKSIIKSITYYISNVLLEIGTRYAISLS